MLATENPAVLVVDDDIDIATNLCDILTDRGCVTEMALDGVNALAKLRERTFDLALLDFKMPGMDGATLYSEIHKSNPELVAIMITGYAGDNGIQRALDAGVWQVLAKPLDIQNLLLLVDEAIGRKDRR